MDIHIKRLNKAVHFEGVNEQGNTLQFDGSPDIGGEGKGMTPMQMLLTSVGACSVMDVVSILDKQREPVEDVQIKIHGDRPTEGTPKPFKAIQIHFILTGKLNENKVARAVQLAVEKYCSVAESLDPKIEITHSFEIV
jgi:putative redox protein